MLKTLKVKVINTNDESDVLSNIMIDDSLRIVKNKLSAYHGNIFPNLTKFEINDQIITDNNSLLYEYYSDNTPLEPVLYISLLENDIRQYNYNYDNIINDRDVLNKVLIFLQNNGYNNLIEEDLLFICNYLLLQRSKNEKYYASILEYTSNKKNENAENVEFYKTLDKSSIIKEYHDRSTVLDFWDNVSSIKINDITLVIKGNNIVSGVKGVFIKLHEIFNMLQLSNRIPLIALSKRDSDFTSPQIKIFNDSDMSDKDVRHWILNEKKKLNQASYKIIKGLLIKSHFKINTSNIYTSINILQNGLITVNCSLKNVIMDINIHILKNEILNNTNDIIKYLNTFNVFLYSKRLNLVEDSLVMTNSLDCSIETNLFIDRNKLSNFILQPEISENLLDVKSTQSSDILSLYYKKFHTRDRIEDDIKGITINIKDNLYKTESSIINIFSASNYNQILIILANILIIDNMAISYNKSGIFDDLIKKRKVREKTNKKKLKEKGIDFSSRGCQSTKQPTLHNDNDKKAIKKGSYILDFQGNSYRCDNPTYPYPGFTKSNIQCCFKVDQRGNEEFIRNIDPESLNIWVEPSNYKIKIKEKKKMYETYVIKIVSEYQSGFDETNSLPRYYFLSPFQDHTLHDLIPIHNTELVERLERENNIFLDRVPLSQLIYPTSSKTKCKYNPDTNNRTEDIHSPCSNHKSHKFFGYTQKTVPCCFAKSDDILEHTNNKIKKSDVSGYIFQSDKLLNNNRMGLLPNDLDKLFNIVFSKEKDKDSMYYRMGVIQNNDSFLNVLLLAMNNNIKHTILNNSSEFKRVITTYLHNNQNEFLKLNNGDVSGKYNQDINEYIKSLTSGKIINWYDTIELFEKIIKRNVLIFEINNESIKLLCKSKRINKHLNRPFIVLIKKKNTFELIVNYTKSTNKYRKSFNHDTSIIKFLLEYYNTTCIKKNIYPENFGITINEKFIKYIPLLDVKNVISLLSTDNYIGNVKYQVKNKFNKINMVMTKRGVLIPVLETGIIDNREIKVTTLSNLIKQKQQLLNFKAYKRAFIEFNKITDNVKTKIKIIGVVESNRENIGGILTNYGFIIPYKKMKSDPQELKDIKYYIDIDEYLVKNRIDVQNDYTKYYESTNTLDNNIYELRKKIGAYITNNVEIKERIENIIIQPIDKGYKINQIIKELDNVNVDKTNISLIMLKSIANEILNDNKENLLINNIVTRNDFNKNDVQLQDNESLLLNINDIYKWIKKYKIDVE